MPQREHVLQNLVKKDPSIRSARNVKGFEL